MINEDQLASLRLIDALEASVIKWERSFQAAQKLRNYYDQSNFAVGFIKDQEKEFKRNWWKASAELNRVKQIIGVQA